MIRNLRQARLTVDRLAKAIDSPRFHRLSPAQREALQMEYLCAKKYAVCVGDSVAAMRGR